MNEQATNQFQKKKIYASKIYANQVIALAIWKHNFIQKDFECFVRLKVLKDGKNFKKRCKKIRKVQVLVSSKLKDLRIE